MFEEDQLDKNGAMPRCLEKRTTGQKEKTGNL